MIVIDLKKAFDAVDHEILCKTLAHDGVLDRELLLFKSYFANSKQYCRDNGVDSNVENIEVGVPLDPHKALVSDHFGQHK